MASAVNVGDVSFGYEARERVVTGGDWATAETAAAAAWLDRDRDLREVVIEVINSLAFGMTLSELLHEAAVATRGVVQGRWHDSGPDGFGCRGELSVRGRWDRVDWAALGEHTAMLVLAGSKPPDV